MGKCKQHRQYSESVLCVSACVSQLEIASSFYRSREIENMIMLLPDDAAADDHDEDKDDKDDKDDEEEEDGDD